MGTARERLRFRRVKAAEPWLPGVNGIQRSGRYIYFSNTDAACIGRIPTSVHRWNEHLLQRLCT